MKPALLLSLLLVACHSAPREDEHVQALERRVAVLERRLAALERAQDAERREQSSSADAVNTALAESCARDYALDLEAFRTDNGRYPSASELSAPAACEGLEVRFVERGDYHYSLRVKNPAGGNVVTQKSY
ncbi:type II secretory pathway component PulJ [Deinobacterium chartae]|uniref:Type II secretory pathway component PulJ n=1 Tax=Deinobacterium chartae TaxID=521158 RepID=A0A841I3S3_9DEIO|nr:hypothetical protein [Deinobacterium chartae]MBB6099963.1 type II secretory pathway component PulJ [Deinobacterium chartae]